MILKRIVSTALLLAMIFGLTATMGKNVKAAETITITYDLNGGYISPTDSRGTFKVSMTAGSKITVAKGSYYYPGRVLMGWATSKSGNISFQPGATDVKFTKDTTLYAIWGVYAYYYKGTTFITQKLIRVGTSIGTFPAVSHNTNEVIRWTTANGGGNVVTENTTITRATYFYANRVTVNTNALYYTDRNAGKTGTIALTGTQVETLGTLLWPLKGDHRVFWRFGYRGNIGVEGASKYHQGWDIGGEKGSDIRAVLSGTVIYVGYDNQSGHNIVIDHGNGIQTQYLHIDEDSSHKARISVKVNQTVTRGQVIAKVGTTGSSSSAHLHFGVKIKNKSNGKYYPVDAADFLWMSYERDKAEVENHELYNATNGNSLTAYNNWKKTH